MVCKIGNVYAILKLYLIKDTQYPKDLFKRVYYYIIWLLIIYKHAFSKNAYD